MKIIHQLLAMIRQRNIMVALLLLAASGVVTSAQVYTDLHDFTSSEAIQFGITNALVQGTDGNLYGTVMFGGTDGRGILFKITTDGTFSVVLGFGSIGRNGPTGLTSAPDGSFFGTTVVAGGSDYGALFQVTSAGVLKIIGNFSPSLGYTLTRPILALDGNFYGIAEDGSTWRFYVYRMQPDGTLTRETEVAGLSGSPLLQASDGGLYGATFRGGPTDIGTLFKNGRAKPLYTFDNTHGANPDSELIQGIDGSLYGTTMYGGLHGDGTVYKLTRGGKLTVLHDFDRLAGDGFSPCAGLVLASDGNFYGVAEAGGPFPYPGIAFRITPSGAYSKLYTFDINGSHGTGPFDTLTQHTNGNLYGMTSGGGVYGSGVIYSLDLGLKPFARLLTKVAKVGESVGVLGQGFANTTGVTFAGIPSNFTTVSDTYLTFTVPTGAIGPVQVTTATGTLTSIEELRVVPTISTFNPSSGPVGTPVTIHGTGLSDVKSAFFGDVKATVLSIDSDSQITATVPAGARTGKVAVNTANIGIYTGFRATGSGTFTLRP